MTRTHYIAGVWLALGIAAWFSVVGLIAWLALSATVTYCSLKEALES